MNYDNSPSSLQIILLTAITLLVSGVFVIFTISFLPPLTLWKEALIGSILLVIIVTPAIYFIHSRQLLINISEKNRITDELDRIKARLESLIKQRAAESQGAKITAESANIAKKEFISNMSHELKTPLNVILGYAQILLGYKDAEITEVQKEYINEIYKSGSHLNELIDDILELCDIEAGKLTLDCENFDIRELIERVYLLYRAKVMQKNLKFDTNFEDGLKTIIADRKALKQVIANLIDNAVKFTSHEGSITITVQKRSDYITRSPESTDKYETRPEYIEISIKDTGPGIKSGDMPKLFKPFEQLDPVLTKKYPGTGLGLALSRLIVKAHGGEIFVDSEWQKGSNFRFMIPTDCPKHINRKG